MKKLLIALFFTVATVGTLSAATVEIDAGTLRTLGGGAVIQSGLLQLIASPAGANGVFGAPTATSFVSGDNVVLASAQINNLFGPGETDSVFNFNVNTGTASATTVDPGDAVLLRWYPTLTLTSTAPGLGTTYGQYRSDNPEMLSTGGSTGIAWFVPAQTAQLTVGNGYNFLTTDIPSGPPYGVNAPATGYANLQVVPEPSSVIWMTSLLPLMLVSISSRRQNA